MVKPFRSYHLLTSNMHILQNSIQSSSVSTFNTVTLNYEKETPVANSNTSQMEFTKEQSMTLGVEQGIPDEDKREMFARYYNCIGVELAKRYCIALLANSMKEGYKGSITIIGNPKIKPYDICYILDEYTGMYGPIEVEQVVLKFSQENGFISEITPNMVTHVNQSSTMTTANAMGLIAESTLRSWGWDGWASVTRNMIDSADPNDDIEHKYDNRGAITGLLRRAAKIGGMMPTINPFTAGLALTGPVGLAGMFVLRQCITWSQQQHPVRYTPLHLQGMPMLGGIPSRLVDGLFVFGVNISPGRISTWFKDVAKSNPIFADYVVSKMHINQWISPVGKFF